MTANTRDALLYLAANVDWLMHRPEAEVAYGEILASVDQLRETIDTAKPKVYAGPCDVCGNDLYGKPGAEEVTCHACNLAYPMQARRDWLLGQVVDRIERAPDIARALTFWGYDCTRDRIKVWAQRKRLFPLAHDHLGRPMYRIGDVVDLLNSSPAKDDSRSA